MGNVCQASLGQAPARQATIFAGKSKFLSKTKTKITQENLYLHNSVRREKKYSNLICIA